MDKLNYTKDSISAITEPDMPLNNIEQALVNDWLILHAEVEIRDGIIATLQEAADNHNKWLAEKNTEIERLQMENEKLEDALTEISNWGKAYPLQCFPEPDMNKVHAVLVASGMTLDAVSASNIRHTIKRVVEIAKDALDKQVENE